METSSFLAIALEERTKFTIKGNIKGASYRFMLWNNKLPWDSNQK